MRISPVLVYALAISLVVAGLSLAKDKVDALEYRIQAAHERNISAL